MRYLSRSRSAPVLGIVSLLALLRSSLAFSAIPSPEAATTKASASAAPMFPSSSTSKPDLATALPVCEYHQIEVATSLEGPPRQRISVEDLTPTLAALLERSGLVHGTITVLSRHTTTAICINERETRLAKDMEEYFLNLAPPDERSEAASETSRERSIRYFHNDIDMRPDGEEEAQRCRDNGWDIDSSEGVEAWRAQEPINAHSHLLAMLVGGNSEAIPVVDGKMTIGQWQSVLLVDLDGPRNRTVGIQLMGYGSNRQSQKEDE